MEQYGDFFPENPQTLDELLESLAQRMAAMQAMLNSMTPEQRAQLQQLAEQLLERHGPALADGSARPATCGRCSRRWAGSRSTTSAARTRSGLAEAMQAMQDLGDLDQLENLLRGATNPAALAEADMDRVRDLLGDDAARSLERLAELTQDARRGRADRADQEGRLELTPQGLRAIGSNALRDLFSKLTKDQIGQHQIDRASGSATSARTRRSRTSTATRSTSTCTARSATPLRRSTRRAGTPVRLAPDDFEIERTEHLTRSSTVLMLDLSMSMPMRDNFLPAKKVAMALHSLISSQFPRDYLGIVGFSETARVIKPEQLPEVSWDFVYGTNMHHGFTLARQLLARQSGTKQIIMITDGEPTAHITPDGEVFFNYPPVRETVEATLREVMRCTRDGSASTRSCSTPSATLKAFVERMTEINRGRAFFTTPETLGDYVLVDFIEHKRQRSRLAPARA